MKVKLYYYSSDHNFGDIINPLILKKIFHLEHDAVPAERAQLFMIGSILHKSMTARKRIFKRMSCALKAPLHIWSSGFVTDELGDVCSLRKLNVCALRGSFSKSLLEKITGHRYNVPLGDGGLLISRLLENRPEKKHAVGIVPHFVEDMQIIDSIHRKIPGSVIISPIGDPLECAGKIAECETVISSSLHGLIAADSFGIPNRQMILNGKIVGGDFKYRDYYSCYGKDIDPLTLDHIMNNAITADLIKKSYSIPANQVQDIQEDLLSKFPFPSP